MDFLTILGFEDSTFLLIVLIATIIVWAAFYYTVKAAVKNGTIEAAQKPVESYKLTREMQDLSIKYSKGEITFEEYSKEYEKLKTAN